MKRLPDHLRTAKHERNSKRYHTPEGKLQRRNLHFQKAYNLTVDEVDDMEIAQDFCCLICGRSDKRLFVDHSYRSGKVRGLLCNRCNIGLSFLEDWSWRKKAIQYLKRSIDGPRS